jgi:hypothetical protein
MEGHKTLYLYRDPLYKHLYRVIAPFKHPQGWFALEPWKQKANERMSSATIAVGQALGTHKSYGLIQLLGKGSELVYH